MCDPRHQGGEGVAGTPGACSQVFCHPIRCMRCAFISTETCSLHEARTTTTTTTTILKSAPFCLRHLSMDLSWQPVTGAAQRRKGRRLRAAWRHEQQSIAQALAVFSHHSAPRRQETARAGGGARVEVHGGVPGDAPPQAAGAQYFSMDDDVVAPAAVRPAPLDEVRPQMGYKRHCGSGFELVLDVTVPQMGRELVEVPNVVSPVVEQNVHIPVRGGGRSKIPRGGVQGLRPGRGPPAPAVSHPPAPVVEYFSHAPAVFPASAPVIEYFSPAPAVFPATAPVTFSPAPAVFPATAPVVEYISPAPAVFPATSPVVEFISPVPAVFPAAAPVVEYFSPAPAVFPATAPVEEFISPVPAVSQATAPVVEYFSPAPAVFPVSAPVVEYFSPAPAVFPVSAPVVEYFSPAPAVSHATAPVVEYFSPAPAVPHSSSTVVAGGDSLGSVPGQSSADRGGAVARGRRPQGPMPPLIAELFALGELPPDARTPRKRARMREIVSWLNGEG